jgi:hypothetical protein
VNGCWNYWKVKRGMVKKGLSTHYGTTKVSRENKLEELTTGCGLTSAALVVGIGMT